MQTRDLFCLSSRVLGLWFVTQGLYYGFFALIKALGVVAYSQIPATEDKLFSAFFFALGFVLIGCARDLTFIVYGREKPVDDSIGKL
jgi:hypothetical protein